jgi:hypothetical protein
VSKTRLVFVREDAEAKAEFAEKIVDLVGVGAAPNHGEVGETVHDTPVTVPLLETAVAGL